MRVHAREHLSCESAREGGRENLLFSERSTVEEASRSESDSSKPVTVSSSVWFSDCTAPSSSSNFILPKDTSSCEGAKGYGLRVKDAGKGLRVEGERL